MTRQDSREGPVPLKDGADGVAAVCRGTAKQLQDLMMYGIQAISILLFTDIRILDWLSISVRQRIKPS